MKEMLGWNLREVKKWPSHSQKGGEVHQNKEGNNENVDTQVWDDYVDYLVNNLHFLSDALLEHTHLASS